MRWRCLSLELYHDPGSPTHSLNKLDLLFPIVPPQVYPGLFHCVFLASARLYIMSKLKWILDKVAVPHEPGLSNAQLMLTNDDLRPGETVLEAGSILLRRPFAGQET